MSKRKRVEKLIQKIAAGPAGDRCSVCKCEFKPEPVVLPPAYFPDAEHASFKGVAATHGGVTGDGTVALVGDCCRDALKTRYTWGVYTPPTPPWQRDDAAWFKENPHRTHRIRRALAGEVGPPPTEEYRRAYDNLIVVRQIEEGVRARVSFGQRKNAVHFPDHETFAHALFDFITAYDSPGFKTFSAADVERFAAHYWRVGKA